LLIHKHQFWKSKKKSLLRRLVTLRTYSIFQPVVAFLQFRYSILIDLFFYYNN